MRVNYDRKKNTARIHLTDYTDADARWKFLAERDIEGEFTFDFDQGGKAPWVGGQVRGSGTPGGLSRSR